MKKILTLLLIICISVSLSGCSKKQSDSLKFKKEYESINGEKSKSGKEYRTLNISKDNPFIYTTADNIVKKMNKKETFIVYFGFSTCPWCRSIIEELINCAKDYNVDKIYYVDVLDIRDTKEIKDNGEIETTKEGTKGYKELLSKMDNVLENYTIKNENDEEIKLDEKRIYAPNVVAVVDGKAEKLQDGISDDLTDPYMELTTKIKKDTHNKFKCIFECLEKEESMCTKKSC